MDWMNAVWMWLDENSGAFSVLLALGPIIWGMVSYIQIKRSEERDRKFHLYHKLIQNLVEREDPDQPMRIDRQVAIIYELRNFKSYFPVSLRILRGLKVDWASGVGGEEGGNPRLLEEIELAIQYME